MAKLCFIDIETTSLRYDRRAWEVALIHYTPRGEVVEDTFLIHDDHLDLGNADPVSLRIGRFYERHPRYSGDMSVTLWHEGDAMQEIERLTRGAHLAGAVPSFDAETLAGRMRAHGICPSWHHRLRCVESLTCGFLGREVGGLKACAEALGIAVNPAAEHTALGDARTARAIWDHVFAGDRRLEPNLSAAVGS